jgi:hypothetical protein
MCGESSRNQVSVLTTDNKNAISRTTAMGAPWRKHRQAHGSGQAGTNVLQKHDREPPLALLEESRACFRTRQFEETCPVRKRAGTFDSEASSKPRRLASSACMLSRYWTTRASASSLIPPLSANMSHRRRVWSVKWAWGCRVS